MANKPKLTSVKRAFLDGLGSSLNLFAAVFDFTDQKKTWDAIYGWEPIHPAQARRVVALAFMNIVASWEEFVQATFIRYMAGATSPGGFRPTLRIGPCASMKHAGQLLTRKMDFNFESDFISWSSWNEVINRAKLFFDNGRPFSVITNKNRERLQNAVVIRNRVAHFSDKSRAEFTKVAKQHRGKNSEERLEQGYDVGKLLLEKPRLFVDSDRTSYFEAYVDLFLDLADIVAP